MQRVPHVGKGYNNSANMNSKIDNYNNVISSYCQSKNNVTFIDTTSNLEDEDGYLKSPDYCGNSGSASYHLTSEGKEKWANNIKTGVSGGTITTNNKKTSAIIKSNEEKFLGLWKNSVGKYVPYYNEDGSVNEDAKYNKDGKEVKYKYAIYPASLILSSADWFFDILSVSERTQNHLEIMKYLMYKYSGIDYGVKELDLSIFDPASFTSNTRNGAISYETLNITDSDLEILYKITSAERGSGTQEQQEYVVSVILNRVLSKEFPNTVHGVVFAPMQFQPTRNGMYEAANPSETTKAAVKSVIENGDTTGGAVYFMTPAAAQGQQSWLKNCIFLFNDSNNEPVSHNFYTKQSVLDELSKYKKSGGGDTPAEMTNGINVYNADGSVNETAINELSEYLTSMLNTTIHARNSANQGGPFPKWWNSPINLLSKFQCTWWANGRASQYLELSGNPKYSKYPTQRR